MVVVVVFSPSTHVRAGEQGIFTQLATIVAEQGEMMQRIDANINEVRFPFYLSFQGTRTDAQTTRHDTAHTTTLQQSNANVSNAQAQLLKYLHGISGNRWLIAKIFLVLIVFIVLFVVFFM